MSLQDHLNRLTLSSATLAITLSLTTLTPTFAQSPQKPTRKPAGLVQRRTRVGGVHKRGAKAPKSAFAPLSASAQSSLSQITSLATYTYGWHTYVSPNTSATTEGVDTTGYGYTDFLFDSGSNLYYSYSGTLFGSDYGYTAEFDYIGGGYDNEWHHLETGASTYTWKWLPPPVPAALAGQHYFDQPPLFTLASLDPQMFFVEDAPGSSQGLTGKLFVDAGPGWNWTYSTGTTPVPVPIEVPSDQHPQTRILPTTATSGDATVVQQTLNPSADFDVFGTSAGDAGDASFYFERYISAITLDLTGTDANPYGLPPGGDGNNQFTYSVTVGTPGILRIPISISLANAYESESNYLSSRVALDYPAIPNQLSYFWQPYTDNNGGGGLLARTTLPGGTSQEYNIIAYGLPPYITDFGDRTFTLQVKTGSTWNNSQQVYIETFFPSTALNNPGGTVPNWYYYYYQVIQHYDNLSQSGPAGHSYYSSSHTYQNAPGVSLYSSTGAITIRNDAHSLPGIQLFKAPSASSSIIQADSIGTLSGIYRYLAVCGHEAGHKYYFEGGMPAIPANGDNDGDGIADTWELQHGLDPTVTDTTGAYTSYPGDTYPGDQQLLADIYSVGLLREHADAWKYDWADDGVNHGQFDVSQPRFDLPADIIGGAL